MQVNVASVNHGKTTRSDTSSLPNSRTKKFEKRSLEENHREFRIEKSEIFRSKFDDDDDDDDRYDDDVEDRKRHRSEFR